MKKQVKISREILLKLDTYKNLITHSNLIDTSFSEIDTARRMLEKHVEICNMKR